MKINGCSVGPGTGLDVMANNRTPVTPPAGGKLQKFVTFKGSDKLHDPETVSRS
jgi:hypothetical protein